MLSLVVISFAHFSYLISCLSSLFLRLSLLPMFAFIRFYLILPCSSTVFVFSLPLSFCCILCVISFDFIFFILCLCSFYPSLGLILSIFLNSIPSYSSVLFVLPSSPYPILSYPFLSCYSFYSHLPTSIILHPSLPISSHHQPSFCYRCVLRHNPWIRRSRMRPKV